MRACKRCRSNISSARLEILPNTGICSSCAAYLEGQRSPWLNPVLTVDMSHHQSGKKTSKLSKSCSRSKARDGMILRTLLIDGESNVVMAKSTYVSDDLFLEAVVEGEVWSQPLKVVLNKKAEPYAHKFVGIDT